MVHVYGRPRLISDETELIEHLVKLVDRYENQTSYDLTKVPAETRERLTCGVVGFKTVESRFEGPFKLNQNHNRQSYQNIIVELVKRLTIKRAKLPKR